MKNVIAMLVMILEKVPSSLKGELSRWLIEPKAGVFVGKVSAMVRDKLWEKCLCSYPTGSYIQIWSSNNEQGFSVRSFGERSREVIDMEGITLVKNLYANDE